MDTIRIPEKTFFKIGEVSKLLDLEPHVLRYWETEFEELKPRKTKSGQRSYQQGDIELLIVIRHLLYEEMYTIAGARRQLESMRQNGQSAASFWDEDSQVEPGLEETREQLSEALCRVEELEALVSVLRDDRDELREKLEAARRDEAQTDLLTLPRSAEARDDGELLRLRERIAEMKLERERLEDEVERNNRDRRNRMGDLRQELQGLSRLASQAVH